MTKKDKSLCGYGIFTLPDDHPFTPVCRLSHDPAYRDWLNGISARPLEQADKAMLSALLKIAKEKRSIKLRLQAYMFYSLTTAFRLVFRT